MPSLPLESDPLTDLAALGTCAALERFLTAGGVSMGKVMEVLVHRRVGHISWSQTKTHRGTLVDIEALVDGTSPRDHYDTRLHVNISHGTVKTECSCPIGEHCKHALALGAVFLVALPDWKSDTREPALRVAEQVVKTHTELNVIQPGIATTKPQPTPPEPKEEPVREMGSWWERVFDDSERVRRDAWTRGIEGSLKRGDPVWHITRTVDEFLRSQNPLAILKDWRGAMERASYGRPKIDEDVLAFAHTEKAQELNRRFRDRRARNEIKAWLSHPISAIPELAVNLRAEWFVMRHEGDLPNLVANVYVTKRGAEKSRGGQSLLSLLKEHTNGTQPLAAQDAALLVGLEPFLLHSQGEPIRVTNARKWAEVFDGTDRLTWSDGTPVTLIRKPVHRLVIARKDDEAVWFLESPTEHFPLRSTSMVMESPEPYGNRPRQGWHKQGSTLTPAMTLGIPTHLLVLIHHNDTLPLREFHGTDIGRSTLLRYLPDRIPDGHQPIGEAVPVSLTATFRWIDGELQLDAIARGEDSSFLLRPNFMWQMVAHVSSSHADVEAMGPRPEKLTKQESTAGGLRILIPRAEDVNPFASWLRTLPVQGWASTSIERDANMTTRVSRKNIPLMLAWWNGRPQNVHYLGNKAFERLVTTRPAPKVSLKVQQSGMDWLTVSVDMQDEIESLSLEDVQQALRASQDAIVTLKSGTFQRKDLQEYAQRLKTLLDLGLTLDDEPQKLSSFQLAFTPKEILDNAADAEASGRLKEAITRAVEGFSGIPSTKLPKKLAGTLRPYQKQGVDFLCWAARTMGGALLADDMGLGKTIQVLAALTALNTRKSGPVLVVCPASVVRNWQREAERFTPDLSVQVLERGGDRTALLKNGTGADVFVTNPALLRRDFESLKEIEWSVVVMDEAQLIKNQGAETSRAIKALPAQHRFALTGTPVENRLDDLISIMGFVAPGYLDPKTATLEGPSALRALRARLRPLLLRRTKSEVAPDLPPRVEERLDCELLPEQRKVYLAELKKTRVLMGKMDGKLGGQERIIMLAALTRLRQLATDPALAGFDKAPSGKMEEVKELLQTLTDEGHKVLVFSQFVTLLERIRPLVEEMRVPLKMLTGDTPTDERQRLVDAFESDPTPQVFLISLKAGGSGLNLQSAAHVIIMDPWWNPAVEAQAIDRTHRIGQTKSVLAVRLITRGTVEERIMELQEKKRALAAGILDEEAYTGALTREDLEFLIADGT